MFALLETVRILDVQSVLLNQTGPCESDAVFCMKDEPNCLVTSTNMQCPYKTPASQHLLEMQMGKGCRELRTQQTSYRYINSESGEFSVLHSFYILFTPSDLISHITDVIKNRMFKVNQTKKRFFLFVCFLSVSNSK